MTRHYRVYVHTVCGKALVDCTCGAGRSTTAKRVTAYDSRDVEPLVEALREIAALDPDPVSYEEGWDMAHKARREARSALERQEEDHA